MRALYAQGVAAWPGLEVPFERFAAHVQQVAPGEPSLETLSGEGLLLCAACVAGDARAQALFETSQLTPLKRVLEKLDGGSEVAADALQQVRVQCFPPPGQPSLLLSYSGRGALGVWLKVVAVRAAQKLRRGGAAAMTGNDEALPSLPAPDADPELRFLKLQHRAYFKASFQAALEALDARERSVLRMSLVDGLSIDEIGRVYDVHRATAARWLNDARASLVAGCRTRLAQQLKVSDAELDELMGTVQSQLSVSLSALEK